ncbi:protein kinase domain-containing protein [Ktedonosporobacter rubrisoli]|nr:protein kinase [Ktedonosporobacter rubrisoli]
MSLQGQQLGRYRIVSLLGSGGMGDVYLAEDARIEQRVALKVVKVEINPSVSSQMQEDAARLFQREARAVARLDHPHILPLFDYGEHPFGNTTLLYLVMPYRREGSLADWLHRAGQASPPAPGLVAHWLRQAAEALQHAHDHQIVHQDVKLSNFLIRERKEAPADLLLSDFGIARLSSATASASQVIRGTPVAMAPEQWQSQAVPATDQYALAVMAYQLLVGRPPFVGAPGPLMFQHLSSSPPPLSSLDPRFSAQLDAVLMRALAKQPEARFPTISDFAAALQQALAAHVPLTPPRLTDQVQVTLAISAVEAQAGTVRTLTLPGGRQLKVSIPAGVQDGQLVHLSAQGERRRPGAGDTILLLTIRVLTSELGTPPNPGAELPTQQAIPSAPSSVQTIHSAPTEAPALLGSMPSASGTEGGRPAELATGAGSLDEKNIGQVGSFSASSSVQPVGSEPTEEQGPHLKSAQAPGLVQVTPPSIATSPPGRMRERSKRRLSPARIAGLVALIALLLAGGSVGLYTLTSHHGGTASSGTATSAWHISHTGTLNIFGVAWSGSQWVAVGDESALFTSPDGTTWTQHNLPASLPSLILLSAAWSGSQWLVMGSAGALADHSTILTSPDGTTWTPHNLPANIGPLDVIWSDSQWVAAGKGAISTSSDGTTWVPHALPAAFSRYTLSGIAWSGSQFVAVGGTFVPENGKGAIFTSPDGVTWTPHALPASVSSYDLRRVAWSGSQWVVVGNKDIKNGYENTILTSPDGVTWTAHTPASLSQRFLYGVACSQAQCMAVGQKGTILTSPDGATWTIPSGLPNVSNTFADVTWSGSHFVVVGEQGIILTSP